MAKSTAKRRSMPPPARRSAAPPPLERRTQPPPARRSVPPPARASARPPAPESAPRKRSRGAAPWAARHAAKRAAEVAARNLEPPRPGSARATLRTPDAAEAIKARVSALHDKLTRLRSLKKQLAERFFEAATLLRTIRDERLFDAKGYASFDAFVEREVDLGGKTMALRIARIPEVFSEEAAKTYKLEALLEALQALELATQRAKSAPAKPSAGRK